MLYKIFLSASTHEEDVNVVTWFRSLLREYNLVPIFAVEIPQPRPPQDKIKALIRDSNGFVGLLTRREKIQGKDSWKGVDWVQNEVGMAFDADKPMVMFIEEGVDDEGLSKRITDCVFFDRNDLTRYEKNVRQALKSFGDYVDANYKEHNVSIRKLGDPVTNFEMAVISAGRWLLEKRYKRLNVSLKKPFAVLTVVSLILIYLAFDFFYGFKIVGLYGTISCLVIAILIFIIIGTALGSRCTECKSYFSFGEKPLKTSDLRYVSQLTSNNDVVRIECSECGYFYYGYRPREED
jgi:hypothetical protein